MLCPRVKPTHSFKPQNENKSWIHSILFDYAADCHLQVLLYGEMVNNETYMTLLKSRILQTEMKFFF